MTSAGTPPAEPASPGESSGVSRRGLLWGAGATVAAAGIGVAAGRALGSSTEVSPAAATAPVAFRGAHQGGITTAVQDRLHFAAFDVTTDNREALIALLRKWTYAAERMTQGLAAGATGAVDGPYLAPPEDTGEAQGLDPANLTITFGFGPGLFADATGADRFGLAKRRPTELQDLPHFPGDQLQPARTGGDLAIQACADDPQVAVHAIRNLARLAFGTASVRWSQLGYGRTSKTTSAQQTPRNLFGFKDGTANVLADEAQALEDFVWVGAEDVAADAAAGQDSGWLQGGSYLVARRIRMVIEVWDRQSLQEQETVVGRTKGSGAPLSGGDEFTEPDFGRAGRTGPLIDPASHVHLAHPSRNDGVRLLRRGYNFTDGSDTLGGLDAGLFFIAFVRSPSRHFVPMQTRIASNDLLQEYLKHTGSGLFAVPPGLPEGARLDPDDGDFIGQALFA